MSDQSSQPSAITIHDLVITYGKADPVLEHIDFDVSQGEVFGLAGVNGAGKTTLIKAILNLKQLKSGRINILSFPHSREEVRRHIAYLPERFEPPWFLSGMEFIAFSLRLYGERPNSEDIRAHASQIGLDPDVLERRVQTYSKGMRQKLGLLGTLMTPAEIYILDEPMSGLDPMARLQVKDYLLRLQKQTQKTILLCSHILADMEEICGRVALLDQRQIQYCGPPADFVKQQKASGLERAFLSLIQDRAA